jgi:hypothetical protein
LISALVANPSGCSRVPGCSRRMTLPATGRLVSCVFSVSNCDLATLHFPQENARHVVFSSWLQSKAPARIMPADKPGRYQPPPAHSNNIRKRMLWIHLTQVKFTESPAATYKTMSAAAAVAAWPPYSFSQGVMVWSQLCTPSGNHSAADRQTARQTCRQAGRQAGRQAEHDGW